MNAESKNRTYPGTGINIPVRISGFKRTWTARGYSNISLSTTYLGVDKDPESTLNGVIFKVPNGEAVEKYDERERIYCRHNVPWKDIAILRGNVSDNGTFPSESELSDSEFWIYVTIPKLSKYPDQEYPIVQSYVDTFLSGCIQIERKYGLTNYSDECFTTTDGWDNPWVNDRLQPRRPWSYQLFAGSVDKLIAKHIPDHHSKTYIERFYLGRNDAGQSLALAPLFTFVTTTSAMLSHI